MRYGLKEFDIFPLCEEAEFRIEPAVLKKGSW